MEGQFTKEISEMNVVYTDILIIALELAAIVVLMLFIKKKNKAKKERLRLAEENAVKLRDQALNDKLANDKRR